MQPAGYTHTPVSPKSLGTSFQMQGLAGLRPPEHRRSKAYNYYRVKTSPRASSQKTRRSHLVDTAIGI